MTNGVPRLGEHFGSRRERGRPGLPILSVTLDQGLVSRDALDRRMDTTLTSEQHLRVHKGDIAYNMMRMWQGASGLSDREALVSPAYVVLSPKESVDPSFAAYLFKLPEMVHRFWAYSYGLTDDRLRLYYNDFKRIPWELPPLPEQRKIADILSTWDKAIETTEKLLANAERQKRALMQQLLTGKRRLKGFEGEWQQLTLGDVVKSIRGGGTPDKSCGDFWDGDIPWVSVKDLKADCLMKTEDQITETGLAASAANLFRAGTVIVATRMAVGTTAVLGRDMAINQDIKAILPGVNLSNRYLFHFMKMAAKQLEALGTGSTVKGIVLDDLRRLPIGLPNTLDEQERIAHMLDACASDIKMLGRSVELLREQKRALMQQLLTGKRRVTV